MDEGETKLCTNCKREIPAENYEIHSLHCARNIRMCPVCKEPVPHADLEKHHKKMHTLLPCKQCGESVCGTDLEDHIRDSCANTTKSCRFCELELPRRELPAHEGYCGVRTEQCPECREWVMIKYRQLHLDSNHGFLRLDDDPVPRKEPSRLAAQSSTSKLLNIAPRNGTNVPKVSNGNQSALTNKLPLPIGALSKTTASNSSRNVPLDSNIVASNANQNGFPEVSSSTGVIKRIVDVRNQSSSTNGVTNQDISKGALVKNIPDKPNRSENSASERAHNIRKKRPAPQPPVDPKRDHAYYKAMQRKQTEEQDRQKQNLYNLLNGLPPVLSPAAKVEKLRKMDALANREEAFTEYERNARNRRRANEQNQNHEAPPHNAANFQRNPLTQNSDNVTSNSNQNGSQVRAGSSRQVNVNVDTQRADRPLSAMDLSNLKPMTPEEFMERFKDLQVQRRDRHNNQDHRNGDRFSEIKSSLTELRRGLNEVIAPYNTNSNAAANYVNESRRGGRSPDVHDPDEVRLPCEFCAELVPADDLVQHQTGCRPDLAQYRVRRARNRSPLGAARAPSPQAPGPVIPCEFCHESQPIYMIAQHQEQCLMSCVDSD